MYYFEDNLDKKFVLKIRREGKFESYARVGLRLLTDDQASQIHLQASGIGILNLLKVSDILMDHFRGRLYRLSYFTFEPCEYCLDMMIAKEQTCMTDDEIRDQAKHSDFRIDLFFNHECDKPKTSIMKIVMNQRMSFYDGLWEESHPGYLKPEFQAPNKLTFGD